MGLQQERDTNPTELGQYSYDQNGEPLQFFEIEKNPSNSVPETEQQTFPYVELRILNNHGNLHELTKRRQAVHTT